MAEPAPIIRMPLRVRYHAGCRFEDELVVECFTERVGNTSLTLRFNIRRAGELVTEIVNRYVWVDTETLRPVSPPEDVRAAFARFDTSEHHGGGLNWPRVCR